MHVTHVEPMPPCVHNLITSISGWRKIFIPVGAGYKSKLNPLESENACHISDEDFSLVYYAMSAYLDIMSTVWRSMDTSYTLVFGRDTRSTGESIGEAAFNAHREHALSPHIRVVNMGIISAPHIMSYTRMHADGFVYITASHNPPEYNGIKFGAGDGGVLRHALAHEVIERFFSFYVQKISTPLTRPHKALPRKNDNVASSAEHVEEINHAYEAYAHTVLQAVFRGLRNSVEDIAIAVQKKINEYHSTLGIVWDTNGGSRGTTFDAHFLNALKIHVTRIHTKFGVFAHQIIPEGDALDDARKELIACNEASKNSGISSCYPLALVSDCDGDRGTIVFYDGSLPQRTRVMKAQEVFIFVLCIELAWQRFVTPNAKLAVVVNGPSTMRCEIIAARYNCEVFRVEVGETNLVAKAEQLRSEGYIVPIFGEASNGGIIIHPSAVRDPLCAALSCIKLLLWHDELVDARVHANADVFTTFAKNLPAAATTEVEDPLAKFEILSHVSVEKMLQHIVHHVTNNIHRLTAVFENGGVSVQHISCCNFVGTVVHEYSFKHLKRDDIHTGGLGFYFYKTAKSEVMPCGFVWIRPSGTEPFMRLVADVIGEHALSLERKLIHTWRALLHEVVLAISP